MKESFKNFLESKVVPLATKMASNRVLIAVRDGITLAMPLIIIGSIFMVTASFPIPGWEQFLNDIGVAGYLWKGVDCSFGLVGLVASFGIANSFAEQYKVEGISAGIISLSSFVLITPFISSDNGSGLPINYLGAKGLFIAIILSILSALVYQWFINHNIQIKMPESVPPAVSKSFSAILPGAAIITFWLVIFSILDKYSLPNLHQIAEVALGTPLKLLGSNIFGTIVIVSMNSLLWFVGVHGGLVNNLMQPTWIANIDANRVAYQNGLPLEHVITQPFMDNFVYIGGGGATIGLVLSIAYFAHKKHSSKRSKVLSPITVVPGLFNINEPTMFGVPIVLNFFLLIPFVLTPILNAVVSYLAMSSGIVPLTRNVASWTMPPILSGFLTTGSIRGAILQFVLLALDIMMYYPFFRLIEKRFKEEEKISV
ncbi:PTS sugar transporter subunit IIC [Enterococcus cecorum]|nr:PTS sugar transporter subunit IIC [Enterococcus cecorum]